MRHIIRWAFSHWGESARKTALEVPARHCCAVLLLFAVICCGTTCSSTHAQDEILGEGISDYVGTTSTGIVQLPITGTVYLNPFLGADRFYDAGYTGTNAVMANIEAGYIWSGHETLGHVGQISGTFTGQVDRHATYVGMIMGGRPGGSNPGNYQRGMAPDAQLFSGAIATSWTGTRYSGNFSYGISSSTSLPYRNAILNGIAGAGGRKADVVNSSFNVGGATSPLGTDFVSGITDGLVNSSPRTLFVAAAGNSGVGPNQVLGPGAGYNNIAVAALGTPANGYTTPSSFSSGGPNNYSDPNGTFINARQVVDIAAPGQNIAAAYYGGQTGGNGPTLTGSPNGPAGGPDWYNRSIQGTSYAAPAVAGGAALLYDVAYDVFASNGDARDSRVIKATLMNSADKLPGWNNGQTPNANGGVTTSQGLDNRTGTGRMNLSRAFDQYLGGTTDVPGQSQGNLGQVDAIGWDFGKVAEGITNDYFITKPLGRKDMFTATLTWFRDRTAGTSSFTDVSYDNLNLELWSVESGVPTDLIAESMSRYNSSEHFSFLLPETGQYMLRVIWDEELFDIAVDQNSEDYGLAWWGTAVPEPGTLVLAILGLLAVGYRNLRSASPRG